MKDGVIINYTVGLRMCYCHNVLEIVQCKLKSIITDHTTGITTSFSAIFLTTMAASPTPTPPPLDYHKNNPLLSLLSRLSGDRLQMVEYLNVKWLQCLIPVGQLLISGKN